MQTFAEQLNAMRKERHITQEQLAQELSVSRTTISRWESGKVLPDIETIKHLSRVLNYNFFAVEGLAEDSPNVSEVAYAAEEIERSDTPTVRRNHFVWGLVIVCLCLLMLCLILLFGLIQRSSDESTEKIQSTARIETTAQPTADAVNPEKPSAEIVITPSDAVAYLKVIAIEDGVKVYGWHVDFLFENRSDIPFKIGKIVGNYFENEDMRFSITVPFEELRLHMSNDKLLNINDPLKWSFSSNQYYLTHMECVIYGTDDNGHELQARATVQYSQEYADAVEGQ